MPITLPDHDLRLEQRHGRAPESYHAWQRATNDCGPHVVTLALNYLHGRETFDAPSIARAMNRPRIGGGFPPLVVRRIPGWATFPWGVVDMLRLHGVPARWRLFASEAHLVRALDEGRLAMPVYGEPFRRKGWRWTGWSHIVLLAGWDAASRAYVFVDSAQRHAPTRIPRAEFLRLWRNMGRLLVETR